mgnify:CR=1 FL=1
MFEDLDLSKVKELQPLPSGIYILRLMEATLKKSQANKDKLSWKAQVLEPVEIVETNPNFWFDTSLVPEALFHLKALVIACGKLKEGPGLDPSDLYGCEVGVEVTLGEYQGTPRNQVTKFFKVGERSPVIIGPMPISPPA